LLALTYLIDQEIGHADVEQDNRDLVAITDRLGYSEEQRGALVEEVRVAYQADRGHELVRIAFEGADATGDEA
jgi:hypothetical protein